MEQTIPISSVAQFESLVSCVVDLLLLVVFFSGVSPVFVTSMWDSAFCMLHDTSRKSVIVKQVVVGVGQAHLLAKRQAYGIDKQGVQDWNLE